VQKLWKNIGLLAMSQMLFMSAASLMITVGGLAGFSLATDKSLATLPVSSAVVGAAIMAMPASLLMRRMSRRKGFLIGIQLLLLGGLISMAAIWSGMFWLLVLGTLFSGMFNPFGQLYRYAAADAAPEHWKARAISYVLAGGVVAGFLGPQLAKWSKDFVPDFTFVGSYAIVGLLALGSMVLLSQLKIPAPTAQATDGPQRPLKEIIRQPAFLAGAASASIGYAVMSLLMTATPLAMVGYGYGFSTAASVVQAHVIAMFAPSFFTGNLIARFGVRTVILTGILLEAICAVIGLTGTTPGHFAVTLVLLGLGWNFMFIGGSALITETHTESERAKTQAVSEFTMLTLVALSSLSAGKLLYVVGWDGVAVSAFPLLALPLILMLAQFLRPTPTLDPVEGAGN